MMNAMLRHLLMAALLFFTAISSARGSGPTNEEIKIGVSQEFDTLNPMIATMLVSNYIFSLVGRGLVVLDSKGKWVPQLAVKIPSLENKLAKKITIDGVKVIESKWEIKPNAKWSDGTPVTCVDFAFALKVAKSGNVAVAGKEDYDNVKEVRWEAKTPKNCTLISVSERWDFYQIPRFFPLPAHIESPIFEKHGSEKGGYDKNSLYAANPTAAGLYNGPYVITEFKPGSHVTVAPNPHFYGNAAKIKKIVVKVFADTASLEANFLTGAIDVIAPIGISFDQALRLEKMIAKDNLPITLIFKPGLTFEHMDVNLDHPILKDKAVRKALMLGLNREELVHAFFESKQEVAHHNIAPIDPWYTENPKIISIYKQDKKKARDILDSAGWKLNKQDGYRYKNGQKLSFTMMTTAGNKIRETVQPYLQQNWKDIGIEVLVKNEPPRVFFGETVRKRKFDGLAMYAWSSFPEKVPVTYHSKSIPNESNGWAGRNSMGWSNKSADKIINSLESEMSSNKRIRLAHDFQKLLSDELPVLPLYNRADVVLHHKSLKNLRPTGHQFSETNEAEEWYVE